MMRFSPLFILAVLGLSCCGSPEQKLERAALSSTASSCIHREAGKVAPKSVDLNTAAMAVLARCNTELQAEEEAFIRRCPPGFRDDAREQFTRVRTARLEQSLKEIAVARTN
jgi:hypothetical protein